MKRRHFVLALLATVAGIGPAERALAAMRPIVWVRPKPTTVPLHQPNPVLTVDDLQITSGTLAPGDTLADFAANLRFTFSRNYPVSNASETVGKTYKVSATGLNVGKYDFRYQQGVLTVVSA